MSSSQFLLPFSLGGEWTVSKDRFSRERQDFDFETLSFTDSSTRGTESTISGQDVVLVHHRNSGVEPSQTLVKKSMDRGETGSASERSHSNIPGLGELATENLKVVGRSEEHDMLIGFYSNPEVKMATIVGPSGLGKSVVAQELQEYIKRHGGVVCSGKFDVQNRADPYQAFVEAIGSFVSQLQTNKRKSID